MVFETAMTPRTVSVKDSIRAVRKQYRKGVLSQAAEMARLRLGKGRLRPGEYYTYRLYDDAAYSWTEKQAFVSSAHQDRLYTAANAHIWWAALHDKLICYLYLAKLGFPVPETKGIYHPHRVAPGMVFLRSKRDIERFLATHSLPLFAKPVAGIRSLGTVKITSLEDGGRAVGLADGRRVEMQTLVSALRRYASDGYLFQTCLENHPEVRAICGDAIATVRFVLFRPTPGTWKIAFALWKIPAADNIADNFWRTANMVAEIDVASGILVRVVSGVGLEQRGVDEHPDSGQSFTGFELPLWRDARGLAIAVASNFPRLRFQAWDIALTDAGPVIVEGNVGGDINLPQIATGRGLMLGELGDFLRGCIERSRRRAWWTARVSDFVKGRSQFFSRSVGVADKRPGRFT